MNQKVFIIGLGEHAINLIKNSINSVNPTKTRTIEISESNTWAEAKATIDSVYSNNNNGTLDVFVNSRNGNLVEYLDNIRADYTNYTIILLNDPTKWESRLTTAPWSSEISQATIDSITTHLENNEHTLVEASTRVIGVIDLNGNVSELAEPLTTRKDSIIKYAVLSG